MTLLEPLRHPRNWASGLVLVLGLMITALTATELHRAERDQREMQESKLADGFGALLQMHLSSCEEALRTASMVVAVDPHLNLQQWQTLGRQIRVGEFDACAKAIFYLDGSAAQGAKPADAFVHRSLSAPADKAGLAGFDPWRDPAHRAAMAAARDQAEPRLTTHVTWPGVPAGTAVVVWYMPVYKRNAPIDTVDERSAAVTGYVGIPIQVSDVLEALSRQLADAELTLECHAGISDMLGQPAAASTRTGAGGAAAPSTRERTLRIGGRWWTLQAGLVAPQADGMKTWSPSTIGLVAGLSLSVLLAWLAWLMLSQSARAHAMARRFSRDAREREARLQSVLDGTRDGILSLDVRGNIVGVNSAAQDMLGYAAADLLGRVVLELMPAGLAPEYRGIWADFIVAARRSEDGHGPVNEMELSRSDGRLLRVRSSLSLVRTDGGEIVVWMIGDVTHERELERRAQEAAALNQAIMDVAPIGVVTIAADGRVATANRATHAMFGYAPGELVGQPATILDDPDEPVYRPEPDDADARAQPRGGADSGLMPIVADGPSNETDRTCVRKDGSRFPAGVIALPLLDANGRSLGGLRMLMDITERKRAAARIEHMALHDSLTGLPNRLLLQERARQTLARARRQSGHFALVLIDLDHFKQVNDTLGHAIGDELLRVVAQRLTNAVRDTDTVVRMGGDEFALLLPDIAHPEQACEVAQKARAAMSQPLSIEGHRLHVTASVGVALFPAHGKDLPALLRSADLAMYDAKACGRDAVSLYLERMSDDGGDELELRADLHQALARGEFVLHYQPLVRAATNRVDGLEALLRWQHPRRGLVPPAAFIPLAEATGLIVSIGAWVLRQACADLAALRRHGRADLRMSVNLSPRQFTADGLDACVGDALQAAGLDGAALELEITESVLMNSLERTQDVLQALRAIGVTIAIDDFGTGYSSLSYLANFPVQTVKVDRSFVRQIDSGEGTALLAGAIVAMAHSLGCGVVAEGVETLNQHRQLVELKCEHLQGYRFSKPVPIEQLAAAMAQVEAMPGLTADHRFEVWSESALADIT